MHSTEMVFYSETRVKVWVHWHETKNFMTENREKNLGL